MSEVSEKMETWESKIQGKVYLAIPIDRDGERSKERLIKAGQKTRLKGWQREFIQGEINNLDLDPFRNGTLIRIDADQQTVTGTASDSALTDEQIIELLAIKDEDTFKERLLPMSQIALLRLKESIEVLDGSVMQQTAVASVIEEKFPLGGSTKTYDELAREGDVAG